MCLIFQTLNKKSDIKSSKIGSKENDVDKVKEEKKEDDDDDDDDDENQWKAGQQPVLLELISEKLKCSVHDIIDFELSL